MLHEDARGMMSSDQSQSYDPEQRPTREVDSEHSSASSRADDPATSAVQRPFQRNVAHGRPPAALGNLLRRQFRIVPDDSLKARDGRNRLIRSAQL